MEFTKEQKAKKIPKTIDIHNEVLIDNYDWLRDKGYPIVNDQDIFLYLRSENNYSKCIMDAQAPIAELLYTEMLARIKLTDSTVPIKKDEYYYYSRTDETSEYRIYVRKHNFLEATEKVIFDENIYAAAHSYFKLSSLEVSPDHSLLAYSTDTTGDERYTVSVKRIDDRSETGDILQNTIGSVVWHENGSGFFYNLLNDQWRNDKIYFHKLGEPQSKDQLIYHETDPSFRVHVSKSADKQYLFINSESSTSNEVSYISLTTDATQPVLINKRSDDHLYYVEHREGYFYIRTNDAGKNFRLVTAVVTNPAQSNWLEIIAVHDKIYLEDFDLNQTHLMIATKELGLNRFKLKNLQTDEMDLINFPDTAYAAEAYFTSYDAPALRVEYSSLNTPNSTLEYNLTSKKKTVLKELAIPSGYDKNDYIVERVYVPTNNVSVPISLVYRKDLFKKNGSNPLYLYGYGAYGIAIPPAFNRNIISLLDKGFIYAIAHVRGGDDLGYDWYEAAKFLHKKNSFNDFIGAAEYLIDHKYTSKGNIAIVGGSAGGMLVGAVVNERPELFKAVVAHVPFVDVLNTMLDETLPLTTGEFKEWGNPQELEYYNYIKSYSPYENVQAQNYPAMYITAGLYDPRVTYWEAAKWVAKLRELKTDQNPLLLKMEMAAGHGGKTGRFSRIKDLAEEYSFLLMIFDK